MSILPESLELQVVTPDRLVVHEQVHEIQIPGKDGYLGILPGHAPLLSELAPGELSYRQVTHWSYLTVFWGFVEVLPDRVIVLAETAERGEEIDVERARHSRDRAQERLEHVDDSNIDFTRAQAALQRALVRLQVAGKTGMAVAPGRPHDDVTHAP
jgi:F-type H+-transporting ATPase subunit epsilon